MSENQKIYCKSNYNGYYALIQQILENKSCQDKSKSDTSFYSLLNDWSPQDLNDMQKISEYINKGVLPE